MCARCDELQEQVEYLKSELGLISDQTLLGVLSTRFRIRPMGAKIVEALYRAKGRVIDRYRLAEIIETRAEDLKIIEVQISFVRSLMGRDVILTHWGHGYSIGPLGVAAVDLVKQEAMDRLACKP